MRARLGPVYKETKSKYQRERQIKSDRGRDTKDKDLLLYRRLRMEQGYKETKGHIKSGRGRDRLNRRRETERETDITDR